MEIKIQSIHFDADEKLLQHIQDKLNKLLKYEDHILKAEVFLKIENHENAVKDKIVEIKLLLPKISFFSDSMSKNFELAVDGAFEGIKTQLLKYTEKNKSKF